MNVEAAMTEAATEMEAAMAVTEVAGQMSSVKRGCIVRVEGNK
jgi:hypothetical protein